MSGYTLTYKAQGTGGTGGTGRAGGGRIGLADGGDLRPDVLGGLDRDALCAHQVTIGRAECSLGDLFQIEGEPGPVLTLVDLPPLNRLGARMESGTLIVQGDAGDRLGASMSGGTIRVRASAGDGVGGPDTEMPGGKGSGMTGGEIIIEGDAGDYVGLKMRRGLIAVCGRTGRSPGYRMLAGTIVLATGPKDHPGLEMRRGTILILDPQADERLAQVLGPAFVRCATIDATAMPAVSLLRRRLAQLDFSVGDPVVTAGRYRLFSGDRFELNKGEIIQWVS